MWFIRMIFHHFLLVSFMILGWCNAIDAQQAVKMKLTMYDDGRSCPAGCDAHVVFHPTNNGTPNAYLPTSEPGTHKKCILNAECTVCFDGDSQSCMRVMYRGNGPHRNTFDFTPAFYEQYCDEPSIPSALATQCSSLRAQAKKLEGRLNCIQSPEHSDCAEIMRKARQQQAEDTPRYEACLQQGEARYNRSCPIAEQRSLGCAYEKNATGGPNRKGLTWRKLLPAACRENTFVGRDGLDCCSGNILHDGPLDVECGGFYQKP